MQISCSNGPLSRAFRGTLFNYVGRKFIPWSGKRSLFFRGRRTIGPAVPSKAMHGTEHVTVAVHGIQLALLVRRKNLAEGGHSFGMNGHHLTVQSADSTGGLVNSRRVVLPDRCLQALVGRLHLLMERFPRVERIR